jgi:hypothetical protein
MTIGTKAAIIDALRRIDMDFITVINKALPLANQYFVELKMGSTLLGSAAEMNCVLSKIKSHPVTRGVIRQLQRESHLETVMDYIMLLFQCRIDRICECHKEVNEVHDNYEPYRSSIFLPFEAFEDIRMQQKSPEEIIELYFCCTTTGERYNMNSIQKIYFISKAVDSSNIWVLYIVDIELRAINYLDPRRSSTEMLSNDVTAHLNYAKDVFTAFMQALIPDYGGNWSCNCLVSYYFSPLSIANAYDSGLYITAAVYFICNDVPLFFDQGTIDRLRLKLAYWLLVEELPV